MIEFDVPGLSAFHIVSLVLDVNGTLAEDGKIIDGVKERLHQLTAKLRIVMLTANTHGKQDEIDQLLNLSSVRLSASREAEQKESFVEQLGAQTVLAIGNGANDYLMLEKAAIGIAVLGPEGAATGCLLSADIVCRDILDALDLLIKPKRLIATLRR